MKHTLELTERQVEALAALLDLGEVFYDWNESDWSELDDICEAVRKLYEEVHGPSEPSPAYRERVDPDMPPAGWKEHKKP